MSKLTRRALIYLAFVAAYGIAVHIGLRFVMRPQGLAMVWPASGLALAAMLLSERRRWGLLLGILFAVHVLTNALAGKPLPVGLGCALANVAEAALAAWLMTRLRRESIAFARLTDVLALGVAATVSAALAALVGAAAISLTSGAPFWAAWGVWWIADGLGMLLVTPLVVAWARAPNLLDTPPRRWVEGVAMLAGMAVTAGMVFGIAKAPAPLMRPYIAFPFLIWASLRFRPRGAATMLTLLAAFAFWHIAHGDRVFASRDAPLYEELIAAQLFLGVAAISTLSLAAAVEERRDLQRRLQEHAVELAAQHEEIQAQYEELVAQQAELITTATALGRSEERYRLLFSRMSEGFALHEIICDADGRPEDYRFLEVNPAFERLTGLSAVQVIGKTVREVMPGIEPLWIETYGAVALTGRPAHFEQYAQPLGRYYEVAAFSPQPGQFAAIFLDVTERKQVEEALRHRERDFSTLVENATDMIARFDADLRHIYCNPAVERQLGAPVEMFLGRTPRELVDMGAPREQSEFIDRSLRRVLETGEGIEVEQSYPTPFGLKHFQTRITPERGPDGRIESLLAVTRDITERRRVEDALRESEARFRQLADSIGDLFFAIDRNLVYTYWNRAAETLTGVAAGDAVGRYIYDLFPDLKGSAAEEFYLETLHSGQPQNFVHAYRLGGQDHFFEVSVYPTTDGVSVLAKDVTARVVAERARLRAENLLRLRLELIEFAASHTLEELLQRTVDVVGELVASPLGFYHILAEDQRTIIAQAWSTRTLRECSTTGGLVMHSNLHAAGVWADAIRERRVVVHNDYATLPGRKGLPPGHAPVIRELVAPIFRGGRIVAALGVGNKAQEYTPQDVETVAYLADVAWEIVERKRAEERIVSALAEKETLLRELYHRTKNNMQVICALLEMQSEYISDESILGVFRDMENRIQSMALVHQMLYRSQNLANVSLKQYVEGLAELLMDSYEIPIGRVTLSLDVEDLPVVVDVAIPCGLLLNELLSNALKHAFPDGRQGTIHVQLRREDEGWIALTVSDDGVGLPAGFDFRRSESLGMQIIALLGERQLRGQVTFAGERGVTCRVRFRDMLYTARV